MTDALFDACIERILSGDKGGLKEIYEAYVAYIYAIMMGMVRNKENAEDLTTDFFIKLWKNAGSYKAGSGHKTWVVTIARNMAIDFMRKNGKVLLKGEEDTREEVSTDPTPEEAVVGHMTFKQMVDLLGDPDRLIVTMKIAGQMTFKEIAEVLKLPMGTVTWKYQRSLEKLRRALA